MSRPTEVTSTSPGTWSMEDLSNFYLRHRTELISHAFRLLRDEARAEEVCQEALIKTILAAPELETKEHALRYLHKAIENLCIDIFRLEGKQPNLVLLDDATAEVEAALQTDFDQDLALQRAEDAAIIREALSLLSPAERAALIMWEIEGRSTAEIATELGVDSRSVRHTVSRARASLRRVLSEFVIDDTRGLTALDLLSSTYRRANSAVKKSSKIALSLVLGFFAFLGFNSMQSNILGTSLPSPEFITNSRDLLPVVPELAVDPKENNQMSASSEAQKKLKLNVGEKDSKLNFPGLNKAGVPISFTTADSSGGLGTAYFRERSAISADLSLKSGQILKTESGAANILISQTIDVDGSQVEYNPIISFGQAGAWVPLSVNVISTEITREANGNYLVTAYIAVESAIESSIKIPANASGRDLAEAPKQVITRLVLDPSKTQVLAQAIYVVERGAVA